MKTARWLLCAWLALPVAAAAAAGPTAVPATAPWDREAALAAARAVDAGPVVDELQRLTVAGDGAGAVALMEQTRRRGDWPVPARDAALHRYVDGLRGLPAHAVPPRVIRFLRAVEPLTLVPHEDHAGGAVPLFNIRGAVAGLEHGWIREDARLEGSALLSVRPAGLADAFLIETHPAARSGYTAALERADAAALRALATHAAERLDTEPGLTPLAGAAALLAGDRQTLATVLRNGQGPAIPRLLRAAARQAPADAAALMSLLMEEASVETAAAALAILYPSARDIPGVREKVLQRLSDPALGMPAALALAGDRSIAAREALRELAFGDSLAASRARLALSLGEKDLLP